MENRIYYIHESFAPPEDCLGRIIIQPSEEEAWDEFGDYIWDEYKGEEELEKTDGKMYLLPIETDKDIHTDDIDFDKIKYVGERSFCIPPHAPDCYDGMVTRMRHEWNEDLTKQLEKSEWEECIDYEVPCIYCKIVKIFRVGESPINGTSKITPVRYEFDRLLKGDKIQIREVEKHIKKPKLKNNARICGTCVLDGEEVTLFYADKNEDAISMAEYIWHDQYENYGEKTAYTKYYVCTAPVGTKINDEIYSHELLQNGRRICEDVIEFEPLGGICLNDDDHDWSEYGYLVETHTIHQGHEERDIIKYCKTKTCNKGKILRVFNDETSIHQFIELSIGDVEFKDKV